jgi:hypothetical protein
MRFSGMVLHGEYTNDNDADLYEGTSDQEIIADQVATNALHDTINVPDHRCPFSDEGKGVFIALLNEIQVQNILPEGYGVAEHEWVNGIYPALGAVGERETLDFPRIFGGQGRFHGHRVLI